MLTRWTYRDFGRPGVESTRSAAARVRQLPVSERADLSLRPAAAGQRQIMYKLGVVLS
jgi:hypothetical protein